MRQLGGAPVGLYEHPPALPPEAPGPGGGGSVPGPYPPGHAGPFSGVGAGGGHAGHKPGSTQTPEYRAHLAQQEREHQAYLRSLGPVYDEPDAGLAGINVGRAAADMHPSYGGTWDATNSYHPYRPSGGMQRGGAPMDDDAGPRIATRRRVGVAL